MSAIEPFSAFMQRALYDPQRGYYSARIKTVGARGDFSTTATLSNRLGRAVAAWLQSESKATGVKTIIEIGGGDGSLMHSVLNALGWWQRFRFQVLMVESSPVLRAQQKQKLGSRVKHWFGTLPEALAFCQGEALLFNNELLDAFPVELVQWNGSEWQEVWSAQGSNETLQPLTVATAEDFSALRSRPARPQRCELHTSVLQWLRDWTTGWSKGSMLCIDYGDEFPALYHRRPLGTLRGYLMQQRMEGPDVYANPGRQDITCDVNFTDLRAWLGSCGTSETLFSTQAEFLQRWAPVSMKAHEADRLADTAGAGGAFQCLAVRRG